MRKTDAIKKAINEIEVEVLLKGITIEEIEIIERDTYVYVRSTIDGTDPNNNSIIRSSNYKYSN